MSFLEMRSVCKFFGKTITVIAEDPEPTTPAG